MNAIMVNNYQGYIEEIVNREMVLLVFVWLQWKKIKKKVTGEAIT